MLLKPPPVVPGSQITLYSLPVQPVCGDLVLLLLLTQLLLQQVQLVCIHGLGCVDQAAQGTVVFWCFKQHLIDHGQHSTGQSAPDRGLLGLQGWQEVADRSEG